jgi:hypothetical protein
LIGHDLLSCLLLIRKFITLEKALEFIMAGRLSGWAEQHNLLSKKQMRGKKRQVHRDCSRAFDRIDTHSLKLQQDNNSSLSE